MAIIAKSLPEMLDDLRGAMLAKIGYAPAQVQITDKLERFDTIKRGDKCGWYVSHLTQFGMVASFGNWKEGYTHKHSSFQESALDRKALAELQAIQRAQYLARNAERARLAALAKDKAFSIWKSSHPASHNHPYLMRKQVQAFGTREHLDKLLCPLHDLDGVLHNLQTIAADGTKRFLFGGRKKGLFFLIGESLDNSAGVYICEGFATGASLHEVYKLPVMVAFDAGNLLSVAQAYRARYPYIPLTVCADNDRKTAINTGVTKAREVASLVVGVDVTTPEFPANAPIELSDFNDAAIYYSTNNMGVSA
jgi:putative DNA primase/helicase